MPRPAGLIRSLMIARAPAAVGAVSPVMASSPRMSAAGVDSRLLELILS